MALFLAPIFGAIFTSLSEFAVSAVFGRGTIGAGWKFTFLNVTLVALTGFYTGFLAALFAGRRGLLIAGLANWTPIVVLVTMSLIMKRAWSTPHGEISASDWAWIGFLPSLAGGYVGAPRARPIRERVVPLVWGIIDCTLLAAILFFWRPQDHTLWWFARGLICTVLLVLGSWSFWDTFISSDEKVRRRVQGDFSD
jgi:hypothetical protein